VEANPNERWARVEIRGPLAGRQAGGSAAIEAAALRHASPLRTTLARVLGVHTEERAWRRGAARERVTAWWLGRLPDGWHLLNDIPVGERGANIDHLIVGPAGVFTVNAKNLTGKVWVGPGEVRHNGHKTDYMRKARYEASRASKLLTAAVGAPVTARPVLAILADDWTARGSSDEVFVGSPRGVKDWLRRLPPVLTAHEVAAIAAAAAKPETWRA
jgi:hypothetical protein